MPTTMDHSPGAWPAPTRVMFWLGLIAVSMAVFGRIAAAIVVMQSDYRADQAKQAQINQSADIFHATIDNKLEKLDATTLRLEEVVIDLTRLKTQLDERTKHHE